MCGSLILHPQVLGDGSLKNIISLGYRGVLREYLRLYIRQMMPGVSGVGESEKGKHVHSTQAYSHLEPGEGAQLRNLEIKQSGYG